MRIVQLANFYTPTSGGLRTCLEQIGRGYLDHGHERILIVPADRDSDDETAAGRRIALGSPGMPGAAGYRVLTARRRVFERLEQIRPDILEVSDKLSISWLARWARAHRVPVVLFSHERLDAILRSRVPGWLPLPTLADVVNRRLIDLVEAVVVASRFSAEEFLRVGGRNVVQIPLGVDLDTFRPLSTVDSRARSHAVGLIMVGRLSTEKSPELALECLRVLRESNVDAHLTIVGDGPLRSRMERQAAGLPVRFTGHVAARDVVAALLAASDVAISPSSAESFGLATLEALACGTPVVVPSAGAAPELVRPDGSGVVCVGTGEGLAAGVRELLAMPVEHRRSAARAVAERYPWSATVTGLLDRYAKATELAGGDLGPPRRAASRTRGPGLGRSRSRRSKASGSEAGSSTLGGSTLGGSTLGGSTLGGSTRAGSTLGGSKSSGAKAGGSKGSGRRSDGLKFAGWTSAGWGSRGSGSHSSRSRGSDARGWNTGGLGSGGAGTGDSDSASAGGAESVEFGAGSSGSGGSDSSRGRPAGSKLLSSRQGRRPALER
jgi:alpha-1,6-mannosyltransferase